MTSKLRVWSLTALLATVSSALAPAALLAQSSPVHFNLAAGLTEPTSTFGDFYDAGYNLIVGIGMNPPLSPLGFRAEGIYNEFDQKGGGDKANAGGVTINATYDLIHPTPLNTTTLYAIGGIGYFSTKEPEQFFDVESQSNIGYNIGAGFKFGLSGFAAYVEARYYSVSNTDVRFVPISFGLVF
ncbi:MAG TPA: outer membrane beta-barrel protein [Gemmatimonadaceae bacterium]|jgi:hypothetical protein